MPIKKCPMRGFEDCIEDECKWLVYTWPEGEPGGLPKKDCALVAIASRLGAIGDAIEDKAI